jgi:hypothetical protein
VDLIIATMIGRAQGMFLPPGFILNVLLILLAAVLLIERFTVM